MKRFLGLTVLAVTLIAICLQAASWQYDRHIKRSSYNSLIEANLDRPLLQETQLASLSVEDISWRKLQLTGYFQPEKEILVRNRYNNGEYGFGVVTLFRSNTGKNYWIDRGWAKAGPDAKTPPKTQRIDDRQVIILGRVHTDRIDRQIGGTLFAVPNGSGSSELKQWDNQEQIKTEPIYLDLIDASDKTLVPLNPTLVPGLSDGPHLAYTFQWIIFSLLVLFGYGLVIREDLKERRSG
jgi:surfeit locus 1 family protein